MRSYAHLSEDERDQIGVLQKVPWAGAQIAARVAEAARSTTGYALCSFLNVADAYGLAGGGGPSILCGPNKGALVRMSVFAAFD